MQEFEERVVSVNRVAKVVKGGRRFSFSALVVIGNKNGEIGFGLGKANEVPIAIGKAGRAAKNNISKIIIEKGTIPHEVIGKYGVGKIIMFPAMSGTGVIAGGAVRSVLEVAGIKNILTKCVGTRNSHTAVRATFQGLQQLKTDSIVKAERGI